MITDRTSSDVSLAKTLRLKIQSGQTLTDAEKAQLERGCCTITMLNRINAKITELEAKLNAMQYRVIPINGVEEKTYSDILYNEEYKRIFLNIQKLKDAFFVYETTPEIPSYLYGFKEANDTEKNLADIESIIADMVSNYRECGNFYCGEN